MNDGITEEGRGEGRGEREEVKEEGDKVKKGK